GCEVGLVRARHRLARGSRGSHQTLGGGRRLQRRTRRRRRVGPEGVSWRYTRLASGARSLQEALRLGIDRYLSAAAFRDGSLHVVGLSRRQLPQELRNAHRPFVGDPTAGRAHRMGRNRPRSAQGKTDPIRPCTVGDRRRSTRARLRGRVDLGRRPDCGTPRKRRVMPRQGAAVGFPIEPPVEPMLAKLATELPAGDGWLFEPKWDGFRAIVFRDRDRFYIQSRDLKPLDRYFPELEVSLRSSLPARCVVDGEIVIATERGLDFEALQMRLHPAASRVRKLAAETPASFVVFDLLADDSRDLREEPQVERRRRLEQILARRSAAVHLTPCSRERALAQEWFHRFEGAGLDGVVAKHERTTYQPGKR